MGQPTGKGVGQVDLGKSKGGKDGVPRGTECVGEQGKDDGAACPVGGQDALGAASIIVLVVAAGEEECG
ncbi:hypothetical protein BHU48_03890 [Corynebacterium diphtheriae]|nr:hypothetical protein BHU48_03890 [Corynebacterium diphtheriae]